MVQKFVALSLAALALFFGLHPALVYADELSEKEKEIQDLQKKLEDIQGQKQTLSKTIDFLNTKIRLTESQINQTEIEINNLQTQIQSLTGKIGVLNVNLEKLSTVMVNRVNASYKSSRVDPLWLLLTADGFTDFFRRYKYLKVSQQHDREVIFALEEAKSNYDAQKTLKEQKQQEMEALQQKLEGQKAVVLRQQKEKQHLLSITKNDEKKYQSMLEAAKAEYSAIMAIVSGGGTEVKSRTVKQGERIASIIQGSSCNSTGSHLHFIVREKSSKKSQEPV